ncbi:hypothetical protein BU15DRAFT_69502 [Melanogaster broomeanus]|nr:hypothetical protein BU15DRAFT_69502 [Melanogaster broomeanus]
MSDFKLEAKETKRHLMSIIPQKQVRDITYDPAIWKTVYANAPLLRPSGPFPYQSTQFLEHTLIHSAKLAQTWTAQPVKAISRVVGPKISCGILQWNVLGGKWFIWPRKQRKFSAMISMVFTSWWPTQPGQGEQAITKLLEFEVDDSSCSFSGPMSMDIPLLPRKLPAYGISGQWPFVCIHWPGLSLVWDMRTRIFHKLPSFSSEVTRITSMPHPPQLILSKSHVIAVHRPWHSIDVENWPANTILQAFIVPVPVPHSDSADIRELRLTHEASVVEISFSMRLLRNSVFDPVTKATNLRILNDLRSSDGSLKYTCVDLMLSEPSLGNVLPILSTRNTSSAAIGKQESMTLPPLPMMDILEEFLVCTIANPLGGGCVRRFSVDASNERCIAVVGERYSMRHIDRTNFVRDKCEFDGVRGRIYYTEKAGQEDCRDLVVVDLE